MKTKIQKIISAALICSVLAACSGGAGELATQTSEELPEIQPEVPTQPEQPVNNLQPPSQLSYSSNVVIYLQNTQIANNTPSVSGGIVTSYSITPTLPNGLSFNTNTGVISGTPSAISVSANYIVRAINAAGFTETVVNITVNAPSPLGQPYAWYPALDLNQVEYHTSAGAWGPQYLVEAPSAPNTNREVTVTTSVQLAAEMQVAGTRIIIGADIPQNIFVGNNIVDVDVIVPIGRTIGQLTLGGWASTHQINRLRIRGTTIGQYSGGLVRGFNFMGEPGDIIIDGIQISDPGINGNSNMPLHFATYWNFLVAPRRVAIVNNLIRAPGPAALGHVRSIVFAGNHIVSSERTRGENGYVEGWGIRLKAESAIFFQNRIEGTRYHKIRLHAENLYPVNYGWINSNVLVDRIEARIIWGTDLSGQNPRWKLNAMFVDHNQIYAHSTCFGPSLELYDVLHGRVNNNSFYGNFTLAGLSAQGAALGHDYVTGNTFAAWQEPPAWGALGDPRALVNLLPANPAVYNATLDLPPQTPAGCLPP